ncbi:hypothetical protein ACH5RR_028618 [Cinchona calisaya]|uniref:Leucine-rich repeat-containing N-terminal plant-type domain-containing protein n=1 Tax=Cinchona calisaya TaxID=153742 RepID=A0ABD2YPB3_9GENT
MNHRFHMLKHIKHGKDQNFYSLSINIPIISSSTDESALLPVRAKITQDPYNILQKNWTTGTPFCNWIGITCSHRHQRVKALDLSSKGLKRTIAKEVENLSFLISLDISNNNFQGHLRRLRGLYMQLNELSGQIPESSGFLSGIQELFLYNNSLSGPFLLQSSTFILSRQSSLDICKKTTRLETLYLFANQLGGRSRIPSSSSVCSALHDIELSSNYFTDIQIWNTWELQRTDFLAASLLVFQFASALYEIELSSNYFTGDIPAEIGNITGLKHLNLSNNNLTGNVLDNIVNKSMLRNLVVGPNEFTGIIPPYHWARTIFLGEFQQSWESFQFLKEYPFKHTSLYVKFLQSWDSLRVLEDYICNQTIFLVKYLNLSLISLRCENLTFQKTNYRCSVNLEQNFSSDHVYVNVESVESLNQVS